MPAIQFLDSRGMIEYVAGKGRGDDFLFVENSLQAFQAQHAPP
jgi:hypothetical protein